MLNSTECKADMNIELLSNGQFYPFKALLSACRHAGSFVCLVYFIKIGKQAFQLLLFTGFVYCQMAFPLNQAKLKLNVAILILC